MVFPQPSIWRCYDELPVFISARTVNSPMAQVAKPTITLPPT